MLDIRKRVPDEFGIIYPQDTGVYWVKQGGGMTPVQKELEGIYIPIGRLRHNLGYPEWSPEGPEFEEKLTSIDLKSEIPSDDFDRLPTQVKQRGSFTTSDEYLNWVDESEVYGSIDLWDDLRRFTYGLFDLLDSDPRNRWESVEVLWKQIDEYLKFEYENVSYEDYENLGLNEYPSPEPAIRPIRILDGEDTYTTDWRKLSGEVVFLMCPNAD